MNINGIEYAADLAMARVSHDGNRRMARLTLQGITLPYGTKLYCKAEPVLADLPHLLRALQAKGADRDFLLSLAKFALFGMDGSNVSALADSVRADNAGSNGDSVDSSGPDSAQ